MNDMHLKTGLAFKDLAAYDLVARQSGTTLDGVAQGFKFLGKSMIDNREELDRLGVTSTDTSVAMGQFADLISSINDPALRTTLAMKYLGRAGVELIPALMGGSEAFAKAREETAAYGKALEKNAPMADAFNDKLASMQSTITSGGQTLAGNFLPLLSDLADYLTTVKDGTTGLDDVLNILTTTLKGVLLVGLNVGYVFKQMGTEIGGRAAQIAALAKGDMTAFTEIGNSMTEDAEKSRAAFDAWEKKILAIGEASVNVAKTSEAAVKKMTKDKEKAVAASLKLTDEQIKKQKDMELKYRQDEEKAQLSAYDYNIKQLGRWRDDQLKLAGDSAYLKGKIEQEYQSKLLTVSATGYDDLAKSTEAGLKDVEKAVADSAGRRVNLESAAASATVAVWNQANAVKAQQTGGVIQNRGTPGEFVSSWDASGNYVGSLGSSSSTPQGFANGGSFMVGGSGGTDSQFVQFKASPDERVTVETPAQQRAGGGGSITIQNVNLPGITSARQFVEELRQMLRTEPNLLSVGSRTG